MEPILSPIAEFPAAFVVVFVILFIIVCYFFAANKLVDTIGGFFLVTTSFFYSPYIYFRKSLVAISQFRLKEKVDNEDTRQYLLVRFLTSLQALLSVIVVAMIAYGCIKAWDSLLPPKSARDEMARLEKILENLETDLAKLNPEVAVMEKNWVNSKEELISSYRKDQEAKATKASIDNATIDQQITQAGAMPTFLPIRKYLDNNQFQSSIARYDNIKREALDYIRNQGTPSESKRLLSTYIENWHVLMITKYEQSNFKEEQYRARIQPEYAPKKASLPSLERQIAVTKEQEKIIRPTLKYNTTTFYLPLLGALLLAVVLIWSVGLIIELLWLGADIADNVKRIRTLKQGS